MVGQKKSVAKPIIETKLRIVVGILPVPKREKADLGEGFACTKTSLIA